LTRHSNLKKLASAKIKVTDKAGDLPHWAGHQFQHAVMMVGIEAQTIYLLDLALDSGPTAVAEAAFRLAWSWLDYIYATLTRYLLLIWKK